MQGFIKMEVLKPDDNQNEYLIISNWDSGVHFKDWKRSDIFVKGHKRRIDDITNAISTGHEPTIKTVINNHKILVG